MKMLMTTSSRIPAACIGLVLTVFTTACQTNSNTSVTPPKTSVSTVEHTETKKISVKAVKKSSRSGVFMNENINNVDDDF